MKKKALLGVLSLMSAFALASCGESETPTTPDQSQKEDDKGGTDKVVTKHTVTVNTSDANAGSVTGAGSYDAGTNVTVKATTNEGYVFLGFYKGENKVSEDTTYSFKLDADVTLTAKYRALADYTVTVNVNEAAAGSVTGAGTVKEGSSVTLTATTNTGYLFLGFYDSADNALTTEATYTISKVESNVEINAKYRAKDQYAVIVANTNEDAGSITGSGNVSEGDTVTLTATVNAGYTFLGFYDGETRVSDANATTYTFTPTADTNLTAKWLVQEFDFDVEIVEAGDGSVETGEVSYTDDNDNNGKYKTNEVIKLTATPKTGYQFKGWYVGDTFLSDQDEDYQFVMLPQNTTVKAVFEDKQCGISVYTNFDDPAEYVVTVEGDDNEYDLSDTFLYGSEITITVNPEAGLTFKRFYTLDENDNKITFDATDYVIEDDIEIYAEFEADKVEVSATLEVTSDKPQITSPVASITVEDADGNTDANDEYEYKSMITITLEDLDEGFTFDGWYKYDVDEDDYLLYSEFESFDYYVSADAEENDFVARITPKKVSVTVVNETLDFGSIDIQTDEYEYLEKVTFNIKAEEGYRLASLEINGDDDIEINNNQVEFIIDSLDDINITVSFELDVFNVETYLNVDSSFDDDFLNAFYDANDGSFDFGAEVTLSAPAIDGYVFVGWFEGELDEDEYEGLTALSDKPTYTFDMGAANLVVTACYSRNKYTVTYDKNGGTTQKDGISVKYGVKTQLEVPTLLGSEFVMWYINDADFNKVAITDNTGMMLENYDRLEGLTVKAEWKTATVYAIFDTDGGEEMPNQPVKYNEKIIEPAEPKKTGYQFAGWYDSKGNAWNWYQNITEDTTLYAHWNILSFDLTVESMDDSIVTVDDSVNGTYEYGTEVQLEATVKDGYSFTGWYVDGAEEPISIFKSYKYTITDDNVVIVAKYVINEYKVTVTCNSEQGSVSGAGTYKFGDEVSIAVTPNAGYYLYRYSVNGEFLYEEGTSNLLRPNPYKFNVPSKDVEIIVEFAYSSYSINVSKNITDGEKVYYGYSSSPSTTHYYSGSSAWNNKLYFFASEVEGYTFKGWYNKSTGKLISDGATSLIVTDYVRKAEAIDFEARYEINKYDLIVNKLVGNTTTNIVKFVNDGTTDARKAYKSTYNLVAPSVTGYTFDGWYIGDELLSSNSSYTYTMPAENVTILAKYKINKYSVGVYVQSGNTNWTINPGTVKVSYSGSSTSFKKSYVSLIEYNTVITLTATDTVLGYEWDGWYNGATKVSSGTSCTYTVGTSNVTLYAKWKPIKYTVLYTTDANITDGTPGQEINNGEYFTLSTASKSDSEFGGWYALEGLTKVALTDQDGKSLTYFNVARLADSNNTINIRPYWGTKVLNVIFDSNGGSDVDTAQIEYNNLVEKPSDPTRKGYTFDAWYIEGTDTKWDFDKDKVQDTVTLVARWNVNTYKVTITGDVTGTYAWGTIDYYVNSTIQGTLDSDNSEVVLELEYGTPIKFKANPFKGRIFDSWYVRDENCDELEDNYYDQEYTDNFEYAHDLYIDVKFSSNAEMSKFKFDSDFNTIRIYGANMTNYTSLVVPSYVDQIDDGAFKDCTSLQSISLPYTGLSRTASGESKLVGAIFGKTSITGTTAVQQHYFDGDTEITADARYIPTSLISVNITDEDEIVSGAFYGMNKLKSIYINEGVIELGIAAFQNCEVVETIELPTTLEIIEKCAFEYCHTLKSITIPSENVEYIGEGILGRCYSLETVTLPFVGSGYSATGEQSVFNWIFKKAETAYNYKVAQNYSSGTRTAYVPNKLATINIVPSEGATFNIGYGAFMNLTSVKTINLPCSSTGVISAYAFYGCTSLTTIGGTVFEKLYSIGTYAFAKCSSLKTISVPTTCFNGLDQDRFYVYGHAFEDCTSLQTVSIPTSKLTSLGEYAFAGDTNLTAFTISNSMNWYWSIGQYAFYNCSSLKEFSTKYVGGVGTSSFENCSELTKFNVTYLNGNINESAFKNCSKLTDFSVTYFNNASTQKINNYAFYGCSKLETIVIPVGVDVLGKEIFAGCSSLRNITAPFVGKDRDGSLTTGSTDYNIGYWFGNDSATSSHELPIVTSAGVMTNYRLPGDGQSDKVVIELTDVKVIPAYSFATTNLYSTFTVKITGCHDDTYQIGDYAFAAFDANDLTSVTQMSRWFHCTELCDGLTSIGAHAFRGRRCVLSDLDGQLPSTLQTIGTYAFYNNDEAFDELVIPSSVTTVSDYAFRYVKNVGKISISKNTVLGSKVFGYSTVTTLYYDGTVAELANSLKTWSSSWNGDSALTSITCTDNTYII